MNDHPYDGLCTAIQSDPEYAWAWFCNLAVPIMDAIGCSHEDANIAAAHLMSLLWGTDVTKNPLYQYGKSAAQSTHEFLVELDP